MTPPSPADGRGVSTGAGRLASSVALAIVSVVGASCAASDNESAPAGTATVGTEAVALTMPLSAPQLVDHPGPNQVGVTTITVTDVARDRALRVYVWFPIDDPGAAPPYVYDFGDGIRSYPSPMAVSAPPSSMSTDGQSPLVVISHGHRAKGFDFAGYAEELASYGYVVAAPNHLGDSSLDPPRVVTSTAQDRLDRPQDVSALITAMLDVNNNETAAFAAHIDPGKIAVMGHSRGGFTAFAVVAGYANDQGETKPDPRVKAIIALASGADPKLFSDAQLAAIKVPTMMISGTNDNVAPIKPYVTRPWELVSGRPLYRIELADGWHMTLGEYCHYLDYWATIPSFPSHVSERLEYDVDGACDPGAMPIARADILTNTFVIRFLQSVFRGEPSLETTFVPVPADVILMVK
jgi:predicted dienelactone hydrolase